MSTTFTTEISTDETHFVAAPPSDSVRGVAFALIGKLAGMSKRDAGKLIRDAGGMVVEPDSEEADVLVVGEQELPLGDTAAVGELSEVEKLFDDATQQAVYSGRLKVLSETQLWQRLGLVEDEAGTSIKRLYTPAMLADLLGVPVAVVRRWHRRGLIQPATEVRRLPYFNFQEVATARRLASLLATGISPATLEKKLAALAKLIPGVERPLAQLSVIVEGKQLLLRQGDGLIEPGGQLRFDFEATEQQQAQQHAEETDETVLSLLRHAPPEEAISSVDSMISLAEELEDDGQLESAAEMYRAALAAAGPMVEINFRLAELLYRTGDVDGARERYYATIEMDENYVEARANLGCVLAESGKPELAVAAFEGALAIHADYADAHFHLARALDDLGRRDEAEVHWRAFIELAPDSPWANEAVRRLEA